uniref:Atg6/beclin coiled-coil domain-containing protein n=1 Tax=Acrobeloides nanus TaxID=290746 RepID=A0A914C5S5_9BILA
MEASTSSFHHVNCCVCHCRLELHDSLKENKDLESGADDDPVLLAIQFSVENEVNIDSGNLLEILCNSDSPLNFPLCKKCATKSNEDMNRQLEDLERECVNYENILKELKEKRASSSFDSETAKRKIYELEKEEKEVCAQLSNLEEEEKRLTDELNDKRSQQNQKSEEEQRLYRQLRDNHRTLLELSEENRHTLSQIRYATEQLHRLTRAN